MSRRQFERLVSEAIEEIPEDLREAIENLAIFVEDDPTDEELLEVGLDPKQDTLFGLYQGVPLNERDPSGYGALPDRIVIYRLPLLKACRDRRELIDEIRDTVIHEVGHYFGFGEEDLP